jgi:DNA-binding transcriptional LysR family regulator
VLAYRRTRGSLVELRTEQGATQELVDGLLAGKLDLALASKVENPRIEFTKLFSQSLGVVVREDHPLAEKDVVSLSDLREYPVYTYRRDLPIGERLDAFLSDQGLNPSSLNMNRDGDDEVMLGGIVSREPVVGLVLLTSGLLPYRNLKAIPLQEAASREYNIIGVLRLAGARLNPAAQDFLAYLEKFPVTNQLLPGASGNVG